MLLFKGWTLLRDGGGFIPLVKGNFSVPVLSSLRVIRQHATFLSSSRRQYRLYFIHFLEYDNLYTFFYLSI